MSSFKMSAIERNATRRQVQDESTKSSYHKWDEIKENVDEESLSNCHSAPMIWIGGSNKKEVGICSHCKKIAFNKAKMHKISYDNKYQNFKVRDAGFSRLNQHGYVKGINTARDKSSNQ
mgnify:CR=1 FL=1